jgi:site-specific DNA-methyltransferase (adenine-specific)
MAKTRRSHGCSGKGPKGRPDVRLLEGDCLEVLGELEPESVDAIVTDPPYGVEWQNERWDGPAIREAAVLAGRERLSPNEAFEVWCGLWAKECARVMKPGAHLLAFGARRTFHRLACGLEGAGLEIRDTLMWIYGTGMPRSRRYPGGLSTTLKPAFDPILLARKPLAGTTSETVERFGTGALNVDVCRLGGSHPANVLVGHEPECQREEEGGCAPSCAAALLDAQADEARASSGSLTAPSRFLYCPRVSRAEREAGCEGLPLRILDLYPEAGLRPHGRTRNPHPAVKPLELMRWLVRLACPPGGLLLDPFMGSGTTGAAAALEGRRFCGIELNPFYIEIAAARIEHWSREAGGAGGDPLAVGRR